MADATASRHRCDPCDRYFAEGEVKQIRAGSGFVAACPICGAFVRKESSRVTRPLPELLVRAFVYPFRGTTLMWVGVLLVAMTALRFVPLVGGLLALSAEIGLLFAVLKSTASGNEELKVEADDLADFSLWLRPLSKFLVAVAVSFLPAVTAGILLASLGGAIEGGAVPIVYGLALAGLVYFPASLVVAAHSGGCLGAFNPIAGVAFVASIPGPYFVTLAFLAVAVGAGAGMLALASAIQVPVLGTIAVSVAALYAPLVAMRMLGVLMEEHSEEL